MKSHSSSEDTMSFFIISMFFATVLSFSPFNSMIVSLMLGWELSVLASTVVVYLCNFKLRRYKQNP